MSKSDGLIHFESELANLERRMELGELTLQDCGNEFDRLLEVWMPEITDVERSELQRTMLKAHHTGSELLANHGYHVPQ